MSISLTREAFAKLCARALEVVAENGEQPASFKGLSPFNDSRRNQPFLQLPTFEPAAKALHLMPEFDNRMGAGASRNFALQFVFDFLGRSTSTAFDESTFDSVWGDFNSEVSDPDWTYVSFCNLKNLECEEEVVDLGDGIAVRSRNYEVLAELLGRDEKYIDATLGRDWLEGSAGSHVMVIETKVSKRTDTLALGNDAESFAKLSRALLAMRLLKPGFVRPGRVFFVRRMAFRFGIGGIMSMGHSRWDLGNVYRLAGSDVVTIRNTYNALKTLDAMGDKVGALKLALRAFGSIYDRETFRSDDRLVDSVTAIEAALRLDTDLSFRSSFQVAGLLADSDDERVAIFRQMRTFYDTRSKVVHGGELKPKHTAALNGYEELVDLVRRLLAGFVRATADGTFPKRFYEDIDVALQHSTQRKGLRAAFGWD